MKIVESRSGQKESFTQIQLQTALMDFADRFSATVFTAAEKFEKAPASPQIRLAAASFRFYLSSSAIGIAAGPNPGIALLDMVVLTTLNRIIWEEYWQAQVFGGRAVVMVESFRNLEVDIWSIAAKVLTKKQMDELRAVILEWRQKHPEGTAASFLRFSDFGELRPHSPLAELTRSQGFFAEVSEAARAADEMRLFGDRAMYLFSRMQAMTNLQVDLAYRELITEPEVRQLLADGNKFTNMSERFTEMVEQLPDQIAKERNAAINQFAQVVSNERQKLMADLLSEEKAIKSLFADLRQILEAGNTLATQINTAVNAIDTLASHFDTGPDQERLSMADYRQIVSEFTLSTQQLNTLVHSVDELLISAKSGKPLSGAFKLTDRVETLGEVWMKEIFMLGAALILMFFITLLLYRIISQRFVASRK